MTEKSIYPDTIVYDRYVVLGGWVRVIKYVNPTTERWGGVMGDAEYCAAMDS